MKKSVLIIIAVLAIIFVLSPLYVQAEIGWGTDGMWNTNPDVNDVKNDDLTAVNSIAKIWNSSKLILQLVAIGIVIFSGVKYIFAAPDQKADIKKSLGILAIGAAIVFASTILIDFIVEITEQVTQR